jgi:hypothetical protein
MTFDFQSAALIMVVVPLALMLVARIGTTWRHAVIIGLIYIGAMVVATVVLVALVLMDVIQVV